MVIIKKNANPRNYTDQHIIRNSLQENLRISINVYEAITQ